MKHTLISRIGVGVLACLFCVQGAEAAPRKKKAEPRVSQNVTAQRGKASFYGGYWNGRKTANGEIYNQYSMTAAHRTLPFNTQVKVTNLRNGRSVVLRINNRGPYKAGRIIDVSVAAAQKLGMTRAGVVPVEVQVVGRAG